MIRIILFTSVILPSLAIAPLVAGGIALASSIVTALYAQPDTYFKGDMSVCRQSNGLHKPDAVLGLTNCPLPGYRIKLRNKVSFKEPIAGTTSDGKMIVINIDTVLSSSVLEDHQLRLAERFNPDEDFAETLIKKPLRYCLQTYISQNTQEDLKKDKIPNTTYSAIMTTCMEEYETTFTPMNMYAATR
jgi:hypothetical protein